MELIPSLCALQKLRASCFSHVPGQCPAQGGSGQCLAPSALSAGAVGQMGEERSLLAHLACSAASTEPAAGAGASLAGAVRSGLVHRAIGTAHLSI